MSQISEASLRPLFSKYDRRRKGSLNIDDLKAVCLDLSIQLNHSQVQDLMLSFDADEDGEWDYYEFREFYMKVISEKNEVLANQKEIRRVFSLLDQDKNNQIDWMELQDFMATIMNMDLSEEDTKSIIKPFDVNNSGTLGYEEFENFYIEALGKEQD